MSEEKGLVPDSNYWQEHSAAWKRSGLSQPAYCKQAGISYNSFVYQHGRLKKPVAESRVNFIKAQAVVKESSIISGGELFLVLPNGLRLGLSGQLTSSLLHKVLEAASHLRC